MPDASRSLPPVDEVSRTAVATAAVLLVIIVAGYAGISSWRPWLREEGGLTEGLTAAALLFATLLGVWAIRRSKHREPAMWLIPTIALLALLDEIRYGLGWLGIDPPVLAGEPIAGISDVVDLGAARLTAVGVPTFVTVTVAIAAIGVLATVVLVGPRGPARRHAIGERPWLQRLLASMAVTIVAAGLDLVGGGHLRFAEEVAELSSAFLLALAALAAPSTPTPLQRWRSRLEPWAGSETRAAA